MQSLSIEEIFPQWRELAKPNKFFNFLLNKGFFSKFFNW